MSSESDEGERHRGHTKDKDGSYKEKRKTRESSPDMATEGYRKSKRSSHNGKKREGREKRRRKDKEERQSEKGKGERKREKGKEERKREKGKKDMAPSSDSDSTSSSQSEEEPEERGRRSGGEKGDKHQKGASERTRRDASDSDSSEDSRERRKKRGREGKERKHKSSQDKDKGKEKGKESGKRDLAEADRLLQELMRGFPLDVLHDLLQLLERVDAGTAADISGIPDPALKDILKNLFASLGLSRRTPSSSASSSGGRKKGKGYALPQGVGPTMAVVAPLVASLLGTGARQPGPAAERGQESAAAAAATAAAQPAQGATEAGAGGKGQRLADGGARVAKGEGAEPATVHVAGTTGNGAGPGTVNGEAPGTGDVPGTEGDGDVAAGSEEAGVIGCAPRPTGTKAGAEAEATEGSSSCVTAAGPEASGPAKRSMGPAMPSRAQLDAAARLTAATEALRRAEEELESSSPLVGPPPPAAVAEASKATDDSRDDQVKRLLSSDINPYSALEVTKESSPSEIKKSYWKLSLLVHPDKCKHKDAAEAFQVLNSALKALNDPDKRAAIDAKLAAAEERKAMEAEIKVMREAAEWRRLRGEPAEEGDEELLRPGVAAGGGGLAREEWMTELPPERQAARMPSQNTFFSKTEKTGRGDASAWTDTPQQKAEKARKLLLEAQTTYAALTLPGMEERQRLIEEARAAETEALTAGSGGGRGFRRESLVEQHRKKQLEAEIEAKQKKKIKKKKTEGGAGAGGGVTVEKQEWRLWDREKDLEIRPKGMQNNGDMASGLANRFGSGGTSRSFL